MDLVILNGLNTSAVIGPDCWNRRRPQPVILSLHIYTDAEAAAVSDNVEQSIDYSKMSKSVLAITSAEEFDGLFSLAVACADLVLQHPLALGVRIEAEAPKSLLLAESTKVEIFRIRGGPSEISPSLLKKLRGAIPPDQLHIRGIQSSVIIGVNEQERIFKQRALTSLSFELSEPRNFQIDLPKLINQLVKHIDATSYLTLEAFAASLVQLVLGSRDLLSGVERVTVRSEKPSAIIAAISSAVEITRDVAP
ncbi:tetrahydrobiopterin biosynthesis enzymes-like protein [Sistotremastrum suecicum HHB10207 ss-3]|uniref:dihydroneopterin aldolase n=1 Tax=Sistotremastrum suecicum HHB10207 ss-3 TaxID=1314776 RepID=A0A166CQ99_9AGAM|nr:tetrahydrobiopterin biosynthesis enzymes-like protein [Sistotremastrum suecicum HHB10207 ss-3]